MLIELHKSNGGMPASPILVGADAIVTAEGVGESGTSLLLVGGKSLNVTETPDVILDLLDNCADDSARKKAQTARKEAREKRLREAAEAKAKVESARAEEAAETARAAAEAAQAVAEAKAKEARMAAAATHGAKQPAGAK